MHMAFQEQRQELVVNIGGRLFREGLSAMPFILSAVAASCVTCSMNILLQLRGAQRSMLGNTSHFYSVHINLEKNWSLDSSLIIHTYTDDLGQGGSRN